jgi:hypothetical protein
MQGETLFLLWHPMGTPLLVASSALIISHAFGV